MIVEEKRGVVMDEDGVRDQFPVGMRVLAVDDDPICLKVLENLLRRCQYHVTITNQAVKALQMLRENRNNYDLVISDVNMPDIDGFKLLELVGLEMDLPVIMLSSHSDTNLVMKGITHGACDYLLKPVRYEELKNIWQHVIRKKKVDPKDQNKSVNENRAGSGTGEVGQGASSRSIMDQNGETSRKRKDQNEDEEEGEDNEHDGEDPGTQKKPRVVWHVELHRKFVAAVHQLGLEKAVPKKILDLMNVEGLTRENVASHLQKYRLYLKRISNVASQQANMVAAFGNKDNPYLRMGSLDGFNDFRSLAGSGRFSSSSVSSYPPGGMLGRLNSPSTLTLRGITSSGMIQPGLSQNLSSSSSNSLAKFQSINMPTNKSTNLFQGVPTSLELNQLQQNNGINLTIDFSPIDNSNVFTANTSIQDARLGIGSSSNTMNISPSNLLTLQGNPQQAQSRTLPCNDSSLRMASSGPDSFDIGASGSTNILDHGRCHDSQQNAVNFSSDPLHPLNEQLLLSNFRENASLSNPQVPNTLVDFPSSNGHSRAVGFSRDMESEAAMIGDFVQNMSYTSEQRWGDPKQHYSHNLSHNYSSINASSSADGIMDPLRRNMGQNNAICFENLSMPINGQVNGGASVPQQDDANKSIMDSKMRSDAIYILDPTKSRGGFIQNSFDSLDDLMNTMVKREQNDAIQRDSDLGFDVYSSLGSCM